MTPSLELLQAIEHINDTFNNWYVWLSAGSDNEHWSLIAGSKVMNGLLSRDKLIDLVRLMVDAHKLLLQTILNNLPEVGGSTFWQPEPDALDGWGLVLMTKIGG